MKPINKTIFIFGIVFVIFILGIGYAAISTNLTLDSNIDGETQEKVFITDFSGNTDEGKVNSKSFISTLLTSDISLNDITSTITYTVQIYNNADEPYCFIGTKYGTEIGYDNPNIKFALSIEEGDWVNETDTTSYSNSTSVICSKSYQTFDITFRHTGTGTNLDLSSVLKFLFIPLKDAQVVSLIYDGKTYRDCFPKEETVATFPELDFVTSTTNNNIARCNRNSIPEYIGGEITITGVYSEYYNDDTSITVNNSDNGVKCKVYDSFTTSLSDTTFESSNYTINNFLILNNIKDTGTMVTIPTNKEWNIDLNNKTINYASKGKIMNLTNVSKVNIFNSGTINCTAEGEMAIIDNKNAFLNITNGNYIYTGGSAFYIKKGNVVIRDVSIKNNGNVFTFGLSPSEEASLSGANKAGTKYSANLEVINSTVQSLVANVVHSTSRQKVFCSFVNCTLEADNTVILANNGEGYTEPDARVWENVQFYVTGGSMKARIYEFYTHGARMNYTKSVSFADGKFSTNATSYVLNEGIANYAVLNYTSSKAEDWYYVKDSKGNIMTTNTGNKIKVGDRLIFTNKKFSTHSMCIREAKYAVGAAVQMHTTETSYYSQKWTFIIASGNKIHITPYDKPTFFIYIHSGDGHVDLRGINANQNGSYWRDWNAGRFEFKYQSAAGCYTFTSQEAASKYNAAWEGNFVLHVSYDGNTLSSYQNVVASYDNGDSRKTWIIKNG